MNNIDPKDSESKLLTAIIKTNELHILQTKGIVASDLIVFEDVLDFIFDHDQKYKKLPDLETVELAFPDFPIYEGNSLDLDFLIDVTIENSKKKKLRHLIESNVQLINENPSKAISLFLNKIPEIENKSETHIVFADSDPEDRVRKYALKKQLLESGKTVGVRTGIGRLDEDLLGWVAGDLVIIFGPPEIGKSACALRSGVVNYIAGEKVLYLSLEMPEEEQTLRFHTMCASAYGYKFSNTSLMSGAGIDEKEYYEFLCRLQDRKDFIIVDDIEGGKFTVAKIEGLIKQLSPKIVIVDSMPVMTASDGTPAISWTSLLDVAWGLKYLATRTKTVIIGVSSTEASTFDSTEPAFKNEIGLSKNILFAADLALTMSLSKQEKTRNMRVIKKRKGKPLLEKFPIAFDPEFGRIG